MLEKQAKPLKSAACKQSETRRSKNLRSRRNSQNSGTRHRNAHTASKEHWPLRATHTTALTLAPLYFRPFVSHPLSQHHNNKPSHKHFPPCPELPSISTSDSVPHSLPHINTGLSGVLRSLIVKQNPPHKFLWPTHRSYTMITSNQQQAMGIYRSDVSHETSISYSYRCH